MLVPVRGLRHELTSSSHRTSLPPLPPLLLASCRLSSLLVVARALRPRRLPLRPRRLPKQPPSRLPSQRRLLRVHHHHHRPLEQQSRSQARLLKTRLLSGPTACSKTSCASRSGGQRRSSPTGKSRGSRTSLKRRAKATTVRARLLGRTSAPLKKMCSSERRLDRPLLARTARPLWRKHDGRRRARDRSRRSARLADSVRVPRRMLEARACGPCQSCRSQAPPPP